MSELSQIPSIDQLLKSREMQNLLGIFGRPLCVEAARAVLGDIRTEFIQRRNPVPDHAGLIARVNQQLEAWLEPSLVPVINATGVVLHTNLGRAPLSQSTRLAIAQAAEGYTNLEFNLETGKRGTRSIHASQILARLTGAEIGFVVNNNAGAVLLTLSALASGRKVIVSRSQLVEIGGGFRIPDVMAQSSSELVEIGTTNRVHLHDYENVLQNEDIALVMVAHHSNFKLIGFHSEPELADIVEVAHHYGVPVVHDLGSGALLDTAKYGLSHEPMVQESLAVGCDLVCFSGDKLLGGPQAGIIVGKAELIQRIQKHPLARALRSGKLTLAGITATLAHYLKDEAEQELPIWHMIAKSLDAIHTTAENWREHLGVGEVIPGRSTVGGGSLPTEEMPTYILALDPPDPDAFLCRLRKAQPAIIARIEDDRVLFDPRTVLPDQEAALWHGLSASWAAEQALE
ncbi:MAG: L-seryl-tRNA(Sec) selenium transferase [Chloroflexota bacterium]|jgi:L-seryl-tRNA(Ser) seleniumtransferase|nr:L-seryl-tRNA(Sec) selenium transferase [Chloroflexota bacterium]